MFDLNKITRKNIKALKPYSSARDEYKGTEGVFLDANENGLAFSNNVNRYPDPMQSALKEKLSKLKNISVKSIFVGNGSDEAIDLLFRVFCEPEKDNVIICPPTYGMYEVAANINDVKVKKINLLEKDFQLNTKDIQQAIDENTKLIFVCCPNNPTGNRMKKIDITKLLNNFSGIVVVDEAYIDFADYGSMIRELKNYPNLVILQTLSKAWGMAGLRIGMAYASKEIILVMNKIKPPYNVNVVSQRLAIEALGNNETVKQQIITIVSERERMSAELSRFNFVTNVYPSQSNFLLLKTSGSKALYDFLIGNEIVVRDRSRIELCEECLRITIGTIEENNNVINVLKKYKQ